MVNNYIIEKIKDNAIQSLEILKENQSTEDAKLSRLKVISAIKELIFSRTLFNYGYKDIVQYILWCVWWRKKIKIRRNLKYRNHSYYHVGENKLKQELDCITVIKAIRELKLFRKILLTNRQNFLMKFNRANVIDSESSSSDDTRANILDIIKGK